MIPTVVQVMNRRSIVRSLIRALCVAIVAIGLMPLLWSLVMAAIEGYWDMYAQMYMYGDPLSWIAVSAALATILWILHGRLSRLVVPWPKPRCPQCDYLLERITSPRCPECGCELPVAMVEAPGAGAPSGGDEQPSGC